MKIFVFLCFLMLVSACGESDCNNVKQAFYPDEYNLIVGESNIDNSWIKITGYDPITNKKSNIMVHNNWIVDYNEVETGDTIMKREGNLELVIHKKDTIIRHDWYCRGKAYK
ncbi:hypothetical protein [Chryseobacterium jejuense]|uniref:Lipoprotein n=1 Tax=Chryseobacterium jejuense TaxID=445960 RepID=A0A2X2X9X4_CHRJE|nr:hypothetical protein [Chryseobacterium jejuense]SDI09863.1 hypothetical protein SAMN05421542_0060 [Chryseobacterium jejuense]SQB47491.1 Uncharacterised protein [Chryseobacterium jejuense]